MALLLAELIDPLISFVVGAVLFIRWRTTQKKWILWLAVTLMIIGVLRFVHGMDIYNQEQEREKFKLEKRKKENENFQKSLGDKIVAATPLNSDSLIFYDNVLQILVPKNFVIVEQNMDTVNFLSLSLDRSYQVVIAKGSRQDDATLAEISKTYEEAMVAKKPNSKITANTSLPKFTEDCQIKDYVVLDDSNNIVSQGSIVYLKKEDVFYTICYVSLLQDKQTELTKEIHRRISLK